MRVLVACEFSGFVRDEFIARGHDAMSCDLLPSERPGPHYQGDVRDVLNDGWDLMIAHPPCTYLTVAGNAWAKQPGREKLMLEALAFIRLLMNARIHRIAIENPIGRISTEIRPPTQIIQPWQFGHGHVKSTCLWLKNLPRLQPTDIVDGRYEHVQKSWGINVADRARERSRTYPGIARAMAAQWGSLA